MLIIILISFFSGILTVLAPCVLPLLPVILGGSLAGQSKFRPYIIIASLIVSLLLFTLLLKVSTALIGVDPLVWEYISGGLLILFSITLIFPSSWTWLMDVTGIERLSQNSLENANYGEGIWGPIALGAALGPVFSSCNPTYTILLATILPTSLSMGLIGLAAYFVGLGIILLLIVYFGRGIIGRFRFFANPNGIFRRVLGVIILVIGILIVTGTIKDLETYVVENNIFIDTASIDNRLNDIILKNHNDTGSMCKNGKCDDKKDNTLMMDLGTAPEFSGIVAWINSNPLTMASLRGKVVLVDFWTYSCINCIRTQPYLNTWYDKYEKEGLVIIGVHAPEFAFEKVESNVRESVKKAGIKYPVALDNDFKTWNAYGNHYWPAKYLIDQNGNIVYKHFGEGAYQEVEDKIVELLGVQNAKLKEQNDGLLKLPPDFPLRRGTEEGVDERGLGSGGEGKEGNMGATESITPETYLGSARAKNMIGGLVENSEYPNMFYADWHLKMNQWTLESQWKMTPEYIEAGNDVGPPGLNSGEALLALRFSAKKVFLVVSSETKKGRLLIASLKPDGTEDQMREIKITEDNIYTIFESSDFQKDKTIHIVASPGLRLHAFTFGD